jgi:hypothetical protein
MYPYMIYWTCTRTCVLRNPAGKRRAKTKSAPREPLGRLQQTARKKPKTAGKSNLPGGTAKPAGRHAVTAAQTAAYNRRLTAHQSEMNEVRRSNHIASAWTLTPAEQSTADARWRALAGIPNFVRSAVSPFGRMGCMTMHDWSRSLKCCSLHLLVYVYGTVHACCDRHIFWVTDVGKYVLHGLLPPTHYQAMLGLFDIFRKLLSKEVDSAALAAYESTLTEHLCRFEKSVPKTEHASIFHFIIEVYRQILRKGPAHSGACHHSFLSLISSPPCVEYTYI